ncbi:MAG: uracil phosphoribosyltransferase [Rhodospirillales bacterium]|jgi:uracil phosphoribosyltransferase|nr:uracil phosphoribosyltransferase [Rhodospirillales bacterium]MDB5384003.1 uracil phosphoribosyltransferase [Rhodospirillales bacterium]
MSFVVCNHALLRHRMASLRDRNTPSNTFHEILAEIGAILATEALRALPETTRPVMTPLETVEHPVLAFPPPALVAVLRAGLGLLEGARRVLPEAPIGHIGLVRDETTLLPSGYLQRLPPGLETRGALLLDPMLATGGSAVAAVDQLKAAGCTRIHFLCVVAAPEGVARLIAAHPNVPILTAALDRELDARGYILPGLGDAGDRCFGTEA